MINENTSKNIDYGVKTALQIIGSSGQGVRQKDLEKLLGIPHDDFMRIIKKMVKIKGFSRYQIERHGAAESYLLQYDMDGKQNDIKLNKTLNIKELTRKMVDQYIIRHKIIHKQLRKRLTSEYLKSNSITKLLHANPEYTKINIMDHVITDKRLPLKLKKLENDGALHSNVNCSLYIALYAVNYYEWDGQNDTEDDVINLAKSISIYLQKNKEINQEFILN